MKEQKVRILIVDDSLFYRKRLAKVINDDSRMKLVGTATNGVEAVKLAQTLKPDVITMDVEMPELDGIEAVRQIMAWHPVPILMFSALTQEGAAATFDALDAGALDFLPKNKDSLVDIILIDKIMALSKCDVHKIEKEKSFRTQEIDDKEKLKAKLVIIGCSTGGPVALQKIIPMLPIAFPIPVVIVQHMPESFTETFAARMDKISNIMVKEGVNKEILKPGYVYITPGGFQLSFAASEKNIQLKIERGDEKLMYKPSIDHAFTSAAAVLKNNVLGVVLTGMGSDGTLGAKKLKAQGSIIWAQDESTSTVFGMPQSIIKEGLASKVLSLDSIGQYFINELT